MIESEGVSVQFSTVKDGRLHESEIIASGSSSTHKVGTASMASVNSHVCK